VAEENGGPVTNAKIWDTITSSLWEEGQLITNDEYHSVEYGKLYRNTLIQKIKDKFGPTLVHLKGGKVKAYKFDIEKLQKTAKSYSSEVKIKTTLKHDGNDGNDGYIESEGDTKGVNNDANDTSNTFQSNRENDKNKENIRTIDNPEPSGEPSEASHSEPSYKDLSKEQKEALLREYDRLSALSRKKI
jgi:hypothetical protein